MHHPFRQAADLLKAFIGQSSSSKTIHRLTLRVGRTACAQEDQEAEAMKTWRPCAAEAEPQRLYVTTDRVMVRLEEGFKVAKVVTCYGETSPGLLFQRHRVRFESAGVCVRIVGNNRWEARKHDFLPQGLAADE